MADLPLKKINFQLLEDQVYEQLQTAIMTGKIKRSDRLTVRALAKSIGTSEMPVRSALNRLTTEGALVKSATSGTSVLPKVTKPEFIEWMKLRALLEEQATVLAVPNLKPANIKRLESAVAGLYKADETGDVEAHLDANFRFKHELYSNASAPTLQHFINMLWLRVGPFLRNISKNAVMEGLEPTAEIDVIDAAKKQDARRAGKMIRKDIEATLRLLSQHDALFDV